MRAILKAAIAVADPLKPVVRRVLPAPALRAVRRAYRGLQTRRILTEPDRQWLCETLVPQLQRANLRHGHFVGVREYTRPLLDQFEQAGITLWTSDIDPGAARFGVPDRHLTADVTKTPLAVLPRGMDLTLINGVFGYGVNTPAPIRAAMMAQRSLLRPGGFMVLGWNTDRCPDIRAIAATCGLKPARLPDGTAHAAFAGSTHRFDIYRRT